MGTLLNEELEDQILHTKINYLNGYLDALAWMSCYSIIGMNFKLFLFHLKDEFVKYETEVHELKVITKSVYRIVGDRPGF